MSLGFGNQDGPRELRHLRTLGSQSIHEVDETEVTHVPTGTTQTTRTPTFDGIESMVEEGVRRLVMRLEVEFQSQVMRLQAENKRLRQLVDHSKEPSQHGHGMGMLPSSVPEDVEHPHTPARQHQQHQQPRKAPPMEKAQRNSLRAAAIAPFVDATETKDQHNLNVGPPQMPNPVLEIHSVRDLTNEEEIMCTKAQIRRQSRTLTTLPVSKTSSKDSEGSSRRNIRLSSYSDQGSVKPKGNGTRGSELSSITRKSGNGLPLLSHEEESTIRRLRKMAGTFDQDNMVRELEDDFMGGTTTVLGVRGMLMRRSQWLAQQGDAGVSRNRAFVRDVLSWWFFDTLVGFVVVANAVTAGIESSYAVQGLEVPLAVVVCEKIFVCIYTFELGLRFYAYGIHALRSHWVKFDSFLVLVGWLNIVLEQAGIDEGGFVLQVFLMRFFRIGRLVRAIRLVAQFRTLWLLVQGMAASIVPSFWIFLLIFSFVYIFAVLGIEVVTSSDAYGEDYQKAQQNFENLGSAMMTLVQFMTLDSIGSIYRPLVAARPELAIYFFGFMLFGPVAVMNVITAVMVEASMRQAHQDQEAIKAWENMKRKQMAPRLKEMFEALDVDNSGELEFEEVHRAPPEVKAQLERVCHMEDLEETFQMLDHNNSGSVDIDEFISGIMKVQKDTPPELLLIVRQCQDILERTKMIGYHVGMPRLSVAVPDSMN